MYPFVAGLPLEFFHFVLSRDPEKIEGFSVSILLPLFDQAKMYEPIRQYGHTAMRSIDQKAWLAPKRNERAENKTPHFSLAFLCCRFHLNSTKKAVLSNL